MIVWFHTVATFLMRFVPVRLAHRVVAWATPLVLPFAPGHVKRATANMRQVLGPGVPLREVRRVTRRAFANYACYMVDLVRLASMRRADTLKGLVVHGWEHVEQAFGHGRGVIMVTGHIGSWDLGGAAFIARGKPASVLVETLQPVRWNERVQGIRERMGLRAIPIESGPREMLAVLRRREALGILIDRPLEEEGVPVNFFGRTTRVPGGPATLALRTGAPVVPFALLRDPTGNGYIGHVGAPLVPGEATRSPSEVQALTQRIMSWLEEVIRQYPDQWYMFRPMWPAAETPAPAPRPTGAKTSPA